MSAKLASPQIPMWRYANIIRVDVCTSEVVTAGRSQAAIAAARAKLHAVCRVRRALATLEVAFGTSSHPKFAGQILTTLQHARFIRCLDFENAAAVTALPMYDK